MKIKEKCELCKCLNLIKEISTNFLMELPASSEGKKYPSPTVLFALTSKFEVIRTRNPKAIATFCHVHRNPLILVTDYQSISEFIEGVFTTIENYLNTGNYKITTRK